MLKLVKTTGGSLGTPRVCGCGSTGFGKSGIAWHCVNCGTYYPTELGFASIKSHIQEMHDLQAQLSKMRKELEDLSNDIQ